MQKNRNKIWAIIPARSGSKSIKDKNLKKIGGRSLIEHSIRSAKQINQVEKIIFRNVLNFEEMKRIKRIFQSTYFPVKPEKVSDILEKIILDADIVSSLMFGPKVGIKLARRVKQEIRYNDKTELLFTNFLKLLGEKCLYLSFSKDSC